MHEIVHRLTNERVAIVICSQQIVPVDAKAASGRGAASGTGVVESFKYAAGGKELVRIGISRHKHPRFGRRDVRIASHVMIGQGIVPEQRAVVAAEPVPPIVADTALL